MVHTKPLKWKHTSKPPLYARASVEGGGTTEEQIWMKDKSADGERDVHERQAEAEKACRGTSVLGQRGAAKQKGDLCTGTSGKLAETPDTREGCGQNTREHAGGKSRKRARSDQNKCRRHHLRPRGLRTHNPRLFALTPRFGRLLALCSFRPTVAPSMRKRLTDKKMHHNAGTAAARCERNTRRENSCKIFSSHLRQERLVAVVGRSRGGRHLNNVVLSDGDIRHGCCCWLNLRGAVVRQAPTRVARLWSTRSGDRRGQKLNLDGSLHNPPSEISPAERCCWLHHSLD